MGFLLAEESACGLPVIAALHGKTGYLVDIPAGDRQIYNTDIVRY